jgi:hippurate hydrolase
MSPEYCITKSCYVKISDMNYKDFMDDDLFDWLCSIRREIHQWPEPAFEEHKTAKKISDALHKLSIWHKKGVAKTGVVARLENTGSSGPTIALRSDMDALPIQEKTRLPFSSRVPGYMHACGHDGHVAMLLGAAALLKKESLEANVVFIFQPAEEGGGGSLSMIEAGVLNDVDMIFGGHIDSDVAIGEIAVRKEMESSYTDAFEIRIFGKGGHAARPHEAIDAVVVASLFVVSLQTIISRSINPQKPAVITIGSFHSGTAYNAISDEATLRGTIRCIDSGTRDEVIHRIRKTASSLAALNDDEIHVDINEGYPPVINHPEGYRIVVETAMNLIGEDRIVILNQPSMGGEDFSYYLAKVPGCFVRFGAADKGHEKGSSHSSFFNFHEEVIRLGAVFYAEVTKAAAQTLKDKAPKRRIASPERVRMLGK